MEEKQAMDILLKLTDGLDPETGQPLDAGSVCHQPQVMRAMFAAVLALKYQAKYKNPGKQNDQGQ